MTAVVHPITVKLGRMIVVRQTDATHWRVESFERCAAGWRFTWMLNTPTTKPDARRYASWLARRIGLPIGEQPLGERIRLVDGILGKAA